MHIGIVRHSILNRGGDKVILDYAGYLTQQGHTITIWTNRQDTVYPINPKIKIIPLSLKSKLGTVLSSLLKKYPCDILIADIVGLISLLSFRNRRKLIYLAQDYNQSFYSSNFMKLLIRVLYFYTLNLRKIPVIAVGERLGEILKKGFHAEVKVVVNGINLESFYPQPDDNLIKLKENSQAILLFNRSDYRKGIDIAIQVLRKLSHATTDRSWQLWVVGERINRSECNFPVKNFGFVPPSEVRKILSSADLLFSASRDEGFSLLFIEAMACGCPIVSTDVCEAFRDGENAMVAPIGDIEKIYLTLHKLLLDDDLKRKISSAAQKTVKKFNLNTSRLNFEVALTRFHNE